VAAAGPNNPSNALQRQDASLNQYDADHILMFGGCESNPNKNDTWVLNINTNNWNQQNPTFVIPPTNRTDVTIPTYMEGRCGHSAVLLTGTNEIMMFGGHSGGGFLADMWAYNLTSGTWTYILPEGAAAPTARCYHAATTIGEDLMVIFGGDTADIEHSDELWAYSRKYNRWVLLSTPEAQKPVPRSHVSGVTVGDDAVYIFGGMAHDSNGANVFQSDLWTYQLGCTKDCSGQGVCDKFICVCDQCWGGPDCATNTCEPKKVKKTVETKKVVLGTILAIAFSALFVVLVAVGATLFILRRYRQYVKLKEATDLATIKKMDQDPFGEKKT